MERIPYPETRYYTKKVLDNLLRYADLTAASVNKTGWIEHGQPDPLITSRTAETDVVSRGGDCRSD